MLDVFSRDESKEIVMTSCSHLVQCQKKLPISFCIVIKGVPCMINVDYKVAASHCCIGVSGNPMLTGRHKCPKRWRPCVSASGVMTCFSLTSVRVP